MASPDERLVARGKQAYDWLDSRLDLDDASEFMGKAFPAEDSFLLGEVALFCFLVLALTGMFLGMFFEPSTSKVTYEGSVAKFQGESMPEAFVSVLHITYDVPFGMFIRRLHHWAAHLFVASIALHMLRVFFTGAYRNPREVNWVVGTGLAVLAMGAAYTGYALPFDEFASTATGIGYTVANSVPIVGGVAAKAVFGGEFPSSATIPRLYFLHVLVIPLAIAGGLALHMAILIRQKHTEAPRDDDVPAPESVAAETPDVTPATRESEDRGEGGGTPAADGGETARAVRDRFVDRDDDSYVVGLPAFPNQTAVSAVVFFLTLATLSVLAGFLPVHNVAEYGPNDPAGTPALIMPDWFLMWLYGFLKLVPSWMSFSLFGVHFSTEFVGSVFLPGLVFLVVFAWPLIDYYEDPTHFTANPLERPWQTAVGVAAVVFIGVASIAGMNNILAEVVGVSTGAVNPVLTALLVVAPLVAGGIVYRVLRDGSDPDDDGYGPTGGTSDTDSDASDDAADPTADADDADDAEEDDTR